MKAIVKKIILNRKLFRSKSRCFGCFSHNPKFMCIKYINDGIEHCNLCRLVSIKLGTTRGYEEGRTSLKYMKEVFKLNSKELKIFK